MGTRKRWFPRWDILPFLIYMMLSQGVIVTATRRPVPDEQRLHGHLMSGYETCVRPVLNASHTIIVDFKLTLNQIVDLDERQQVLTTNVFIDQIWKDENLEWDPADYNGIRNLRVPSDQVWLPDTFVFNNADEVSTGFMQGVYVLINSNGSVLWPVPVKLKSSCKVDIAYFPFDDQVCLLRFGSWMYSNESMDFQSSLEKVDISHLIDNSEWELRAVKFHRSTQHYACCDKPHPDLTFTLHIRRRTFYYIWNIIVPCIMLSVLTLLTFWLPPTSGEKISLGLSVFLAFSMFMLLIAEEVPATSESVPLIGIYLTTVMTMTSMSVIMAVMVINLYNRSSKARRAPRWLKKVVLDWICKLLCMTHDIERLAQTIRLEDEEELRYRCNVHEGRVRRLSCVTSQPSRNRYREYAELILREARKKYATNGVYPANNCDWFELKRRAADSDRQLRDFRSNGVKHESLSHSNEANKEQHNNEEEPVWKLRDDVIERCTLLVHENSNEAGNMAAAADNRCHTNHFRPSESVIENSKAKTKHADHRQDNNGNSKHRKDVGRCDDRPTTEPLTKGEIFPECTKEQKYAWRKEMVVEWQTIATVVDRLLFWLFLIITVATYIIVLIVMPYTKPSFTDDRDATPIDLLRRHSNGGHGV